MSPWNSGSLLAKWSIPYQFNTFCSLTSFFLFSKKRSHNWSEVSRRYGFGKETQVTWSVWSVTSEDQFKHTNFTWTHYRWARGPIVWTTTSRTGVCGSIPPFASFFSFTHAHCGNWACASAFSDVISLFIISQTHMDYDTLVDNLRCDSRLFNRASRTALTPPLRDRVLASWSPMGLGVFSRRGKPLVLWGGTGDVLSKKGKEDSRNPWRYLRPTWKGTTRLTLGGFLAPRPGEDRFSSGTHSARRASGPQNGETPSQGGVLDQTGLW